MEEPLFKIELAATSKSCMLQGLSGGYTMYHDTSFTIHIYIVVSCSLGFMVSLHWLFSSISCNILPIEDYSFFALAIQFYHCNI